jgi:hypothetical protein
LLHLVFGLVQFGGQQFALLSVVEGVGDVRGGDGPSSERVKPIDWAVLMPLIRSTALAS